MSLLEKHLLQKGSFHIFLAFYFILSPNKPSHKQSGEEASADALDGESVVNLPMKILNLDASERFTPSQIPLASIHDNEPPCWLIRQQLQVGA